MPLKRPFLRPFLALLACVLASCGGGGGGGTGANSPVHVTSDHSSFTIEGIAPQPPVSNLVTFTLSGGGAGPFYVDAAATTSDITAVLTILSESRATVALHSNLDASIGQHRQGQITFRVCNDARCASVAWSQTYPYSYTQYQVDLAPITLTGTESLPLATITRVVTPADVDHRLSVSGVPWLSGSHDDSGNLVLTASGLGLDAGSYSGALQLSDVQAPYATVGIPVSLTLGTGMIAPALADMVQTRNTGPAALQGTAPIAFAGGLSAPWTAQSDKDWLVIDSPSGSGSGTLRYHVNAIAANAAIPNWHSDTATVTLQASGLSVARASLTLRRQLPEVLMLTPSQVEPNQAATLTVTGRGFSQLSGVEQIQIGGEAVAGGSILSDTRAVLQMPARAAGSLQVGVSNLSNARSAQANLAVTTATLRSAFVPAPANDSKNSIVYDPSRHAVFAGSYYGNTLQRFKWEGGNTWALTAIPWSGIWRVQMAPDRRTLYVLATDGLYEVDPETLATKVRHPAPDGQNFFRGFYFDEPLPLTNDLRLWLPQSGGQYFDLQLGSYQFAADSEFGNVGYEHLTATPDGAHLYTLESSYTPRPPDGWYSAASHTTAPMPASVQTAYRTNFDLQGAIGIFDGNAVYRTADWSLVGTIMAPAGELLLPSARVSPDGTRAYVLASGNGTNNAERVDVFDLTRLQPGTSDVLLLGSIPIANPATACNGEYECDVLGRLALDPVGKTLFWVGNAGLTVIPIPDTFTGHAGTRQTGQTSRLKPAAAAKSKPAF